MDIIPVGSGDPTPSYLRALTYFAIEGHPRRLVQVLADVPLEHTSRALRFASSSSRSPPSLLAWVIHAGTYVLVPFLCSPYLSIAVLLNIFPSTDYEPRSTERVDEGSPPDLCRNEVSRYTIGDRFYMISLGKPPAVSTTTQPNPTQLNQQKPVLHS
ncbi:hypothetical protein F5B20DRAFT_46720 [Whalleya microplaca]|nr:hypothetical protein F5B20DRAFT_46720 [Whalleya microplaca]